ncbi:hypothetical protein P154DRAFT_430908 [Amniculicola lignicola CBS 123094]|uniref:PHD and RING finger domain-containing protein n=1 Tax=Amniculicola lignicola CBS 123094 TaxID=1392246 RepID=A0A6A5WL34_9PLEO|nr:hypothetical protein P154DRAFT_430908 [Amniculicola lignicola CBS 123094]
MAETCIVCLGDLAPQVEDDTAATAAALDVDSLDNGADPGRHRSHLAQIIAPDSAPTPPEDELVAHLIPCGHNLHNECLKPWVERANSCPICRASFNTVELCARLGGPLVSSYNVQDKQQVADIDPSMIVDDEYLFEEDDGSYDACMVCDEFGDSATLMFCNSCEQLSHVFCAGLDRMPRSGPWYCGQCMENPQALASASRAQRIGGPAAFANGYDRRRRRTQAPDEWLGVWQSVWNRLHFDIEFPFSDDDQSDNRSEVHRRENEEWDQRFNIARQLGAGNRFRAANNVVHPRARRTSLHREPPKTPKDPESQEELRAWNQFEKAREQLAQIDGRSTASSISSRHRTRKSVNASPAEPASNPRRRKRTSSIASPVESDPQEREPERKLKRPRTRLRLDNGESSSAAVRRVPAEENKSPAVVVKDTEDSSAPGFLQSLLKEVEVDRHAERDREIAAPKPKQIIIERACSPQNSSPGLSPVYPTPRGMSTPPPLNISRAKMADGQDVQLSPTYSPYSPTDEEHRHGRRKHSHPSPGLESPPRSKDSSPSRASSLTFSTKQELQRMVTAALKPFYTRKDITKDQYTYVNRDVSRLMYERVGDAGASALADQDTREKWQKMASDEVDSHVKALTKPSTASGLIVPIMMKEPAPAS